MIYNIKGLMKIEGKKKFIYANEYMQCDEMMRDNSTR